MFGKKMNYKVEGMTCEHCVKKVGAAIESVEGVKSCKVALKKQTAVVRFTDADLGLEAEHNIFEQMERVVDEAGYHLVAE
ncbi:heavy-metal-associated domain-containing protein [Lactococcus termiticola]|uniref:Copper chaperone n=1 Tax=Lactococcus termiticola TaxID=2169526 RepID=A0A2R5HKJ7_9LACT|nr:heavy-metal-associated domain-containing protein [Lactococcus termiticola]GBG97378.1 copper chaperone [Lactococcus termiticola]